MTVPNSINRIVQQVVLFSLAIASQVSVVAQSPTPLALQIEKQTQRLNSADPEERRDALMRLGAMNRVEASRRAVPLLKDIVPTVRIAAINALRSLPPDEALTALISLFLDKDEFVRSEVALAIGRTRSRNAVPPLIERLKFDKSDQVRAAAVVALGEIGDPSAVVELSKLLSPTMAEGKGKRKQKENEFVLRAAAGSLGQIRNRAAVPALINALQSESVPVDVRREAARSLGLIGDNSAVPALRDAAASIDPYLARIAHQALRRILGAQASLPG